MNTNDYRVTYDVEFWKKECEAKGHCSSPFGAVLAVNALCDEIERLRGQVRVLREALKDVRNNNGRSDCYRNMLVEKALAATDPLRELTKTHKELDAAIKGEL